MSNDAVYNSKVCWLGLLMIVGHHTRCWWESPCREACWPKSFWPWPEGQYNDQETVDCPEQDQDCQSPIPHLPTQSTYAKSTASHLTHSVLGAICFWAEVLLPWPAVPVPGIKAIQKGNVALKTLVDEISLSNDLLKKPWWRNGGHGAVLYGIRHPRTRSRNYAVWPKGAVL